MSEIKEITTDRQAFEYITKKLLDQLSQSKNPMNQDCQYRSIDAHLHKDYVIDSIKTMVEKKLIMLPLNKSAEDVVDYFLESRGFGLADFDDDVDDIYFAALENVIKNPGKYQILCCAVGHLINDQAYSPSLEGNMISDEFVSNAVKQSNPNWEMDNNSIEMLFTLQKIHDTIDPRHWSRIFKKLNDLFVFDSNGKFIKEMVIFNSLTLSQIMKDSTLFSKFELYDWGFDNIEKFDYSPNASV